MNSAWWQWLGAIGMAGVALQGARMVRKPDTYLGPRAYDASNPRTVRQFGLFYLAIGSVALVLILIKLVQG